MWCDVYVYMIYISSIISWCWVSSPDGPRVPPYQSTHLSSGALIGCPSWLPFSRKSKGNSPGLLPSSSLFLFPTLLCQPSWVSSWGLQRPCTSPLLSWRLPSGPWTSWGGNQSPSSPESPPLRVSESQWSPHHPAPALQFLSTMCMENIYTISLLNLYP